MAAGEIQLHIDGMTCAACVRRVEKALLKVPGVDSADVNLASERARICFDSEKPDANLLVQVLAKAGYEAQPLKGMADESDALVEAAHLRSQRQGFWMLTAVFLTLPLALPMLLMPLGIRLMLPPLMQLLLASIVQFGFGGGIYLTAFKALRQGSGTMELLVAVGTGVAWALSLYTMIFLPTEPLYFEAGAMVVTLVLFGKWLEARARWQTGDALRSLAQMRPKQVRLLRENREILIAVETVAKGDLAVVLPGERIGVDGRIVEGRSHIDQSLLTGEALPVAREIGDLVAGASLNGEGRLIIEVTAVGRDTMLAKIEQLVERAQAEKTPTQRLVDLVSSVFVAIVLGLALLTFVGWLLAGNDVSNALLKAVAVLVIACPCALGLATPAALVVGLGVAARHGILIRDARALELARKVDVIAFDKTGTLTSGRPRLMSVVASAEADALLALAASLQQGSDHPLAKASLAAAQAKALVLSAPTEVRLLAGRGLSGQVADRSLMLGSARFMREQNLDLTPFQLQADLAEAEGATLAFVADIDQSRILGFLSFADALKPDAGAAITQLRRSGMDVALLTGDRLAAARPVAQTLNISRIEAELLPQDKAEWVVKARAQGRVVAMVGDGINDAPGLAAADIGMAMASGSDIAVFSASITLMRPDPQLVPQALDIAKATFGKIRQNLFWASIYNVAAIPLAAFGFLSPTLAGAAMAFSSVSVVANALVLKRWQPKA